MTKYEQELIASMDRTLEEMRAIAMDFKRMAYESDEIIGVMPANRRKLQRYATYDFFNKSYVPRERVHVDVRMSRDG